MFTFQAIVGAAIGLFVASLIVATLLAILQHARLTYEKSKVEILELRKRQRQIAGD